MAHSPPRMLRRLLSMALRQRRGIRPVLAAGVWDGSVGLVQRAEQAGGVPADTAQYERFRT